MKNPAHTPWTKEELDGLVNMYLNGATYVEMAKTIGRTESSMHSKVRELDLVKLKREATKAERFDLFHLVPKAKGLPELSEISGLPLARVRVLIRDYSYGFRAIKYYFNNPGKIDRPYW